MNWKKNVFYREKWNFEPVENFPHNKAFLISGKFLLVLFPLYL